MQFANLLAEYLQQSEPDDAAETCDACGLLSPAGATACETCGAPIELPKEAE